LILLRDECYPKIFVDTERRLFNASLFSFLSVSLVLTLNISFFILGLEYHPIIDQVYPVVNHLYTIATSSVRIAKCKRSNMMRTIKKKCYEYQTYPRPSQTAEINALCYIIFWDPNEGQTVYTDLPLSLPSRNTISNQLHYLTLVPKRYNHLVALRKVVYIVVEPVHSPCLLSHIPLF